jgi:RNA-directed DNA polymerase
MAKHHPGIPFERFADDILCHGVSEAQAQWLKRVLERRFAECGLELHPQKTKIVYCKDGDRRGHYPNEKFDFLGYSASSEGWHVQWGASPTGVEVSAP